MVEKNEKQFDVVQARATISRYLKEHPEAKPPAGPDAPEKLAIKDPEKLDQSIMSVARGAVDEFEDTREFSPGRRMEINEHRVLNVVPVSYASVDENAGLSLQIEKGFRRYLEDESLQFEMLMMQLKRGSEPVAEFVTSLQSDDEGNGLLAIRHRWVEPAFRERGKGVGTMMLHGIESFAQERARQKGASQRIVVNAGQLEVMNWALKNGFAPASPNDEATLEEILVFLEKGEGEFAVGSRTYIFPKKVAEKHAKTRELKGFTAQYGITHEDIQKSVRINFEKKIEMVNEKSSIIRSSREGVADMLGLPL